MTVSEENKRAYDAQKDGDRVYTEFLNKLVLYSSWILTTSITWFIALYDKVNIQELRIIFICIVWFSLVTILSWLFRIHSSAIQKTIEASMHNVWWKLSQFKDRLEKKELISNWSDEIEEKTKEGIKFYEVGHAMLKWKHKNQWILGGILVYICIVFFCLTCISVLFLLINIK